MFRIIGYILGTLIFILLSIVGVFYTLIKHLVKGDYSFKKQFLPIFKNLALVFDGFANATAGELLTDMLLKHRKDGDVYHNAVKYSKYFHTISAITGVNKKKGTLEKIGKRFNAMLDFFLGANHSINAINECIDYECKRN